MLQIKTPEQTGQDLEKEASDKRELQSQLTVETEDALSRMVRSHWTTAKYSRQQITERLLDCLRRRKGVYSPQKLNEIRKTKGSEIYMGITGAKCRAAKAWLSDLFNPAGDRPWTLESTIVPEIPDTIKQKLIAEAVQGGVQQGIDIETIKEMLVEHRDRLLDQLKQEAEDRAEKMADKIEDILTEGGWRQEFDEFLDDFVTFPYAVMKGLEFTERKRIKWVDIGTGEQVPETTRVVTPAVRRVSPFYFYPSPSVSNSLDGHWCIEHHRYTRNDLANMRNAPGYNAENIAKALSQYAAGGLREWMFEDAERESIEGKNYIYQNETIDAIEWTGYLQGQKLIDEGVEESVVTDPFEEYLVSLVIVGGFTIRALINPDPSGKSDYHFTSWDPIPGSFAGNSLPELLSDQQDMCNAAARSLANNMGIASGPQVWAKVDLLADGADITSMHPWKVWQGNSDNSTGAPFGFFQPDSHANELMTIYERFSKYADEITGLPAYAYGSDSGAGAAKTASGLGMLLNAASKTIKHGVRNIDLRIITPIVEKVFHIEMLTGADPDIKGDAVAKARGSEALIHKEQAAQRSLEMLQMSGSNPMDAQLFGLEGRHEQWREYLKNNDVAVDRILPDLDQIKQRMAQENAIANQPVQE